jgi:hypothetical protein
MEAMVFGDGFEFGEFVLTEADIVTEILGVFEAKIGGRGGGYRGAFDHRLAPGGGDGCDTEELLDLRVEFLRVGAWVGRKGRKEVEQGSGEGRAHLGDIREDIVCDHNWGRKYIQEVGGGDSLNIYTWEISSISVFCVRIGLD